MTKEELEEHFILEEKCDLETIRTALINSDEIFAVNEATLAVKNNYIYSVLHERNTCMEYEDDCSAKAVFDSLIEKLL